MGKRKGTCPACGERLPLTRHGVVCGHSVLRPNRAMAKTCAGTGAEPVEVEEIEERMWE